MIFGVFLKKGISGFTLVELMVSLFIMSVSTSLLLANYPDSTIRLTLLNNTHTTSLLIREAQIRGSAIDSGGNDVGGYGVFFNSVTPSKVILFNDNTKDLTGFSLGKKNTAGFDIGDGLYNTNVSLDDIKSTIQFKDGFTFKKLCVGSSTAPYAIAPYGYICNGNNLGIDGISSINSLTISFVRPNQTAHIYINNSTENDFPSACIQLYSPKSPETGHIRSVEVYHSGMIATRVLPCS